jgi:hypothetical protein
LLGFALPVLILAGCDPSQPKGAPASEPPQATAPALPAPQQAPTPDQPPPLTLEQKRVRLLIQQVEDAYAKGDADYRKGKLPEAKVEFDRAVDLMLSSGIDIKQQCRVAGRVQPHRGRGERAGDGGAQAGQWLCAQGGAHARPTWPAT